MKFYHCHPIRGYTQLITTEDGLKIDQIKILDQLHLEIPYEELLPMRCSANTSFPILLIFFAVLITAGYFTKELSKPISSIEDATATILLGLPVLGLIYWAYSQWKWSMTVTTGWGDIVLINDNKTRPALEQFVVELRAHTKEYLYARYARFDPFQPVEEQLISYAWLYERKVITQEQLLTLQQ